MEILTIPPDKFQRYYHAMQIASVITTPDITRFLLDLGGCEDILKRFFPEKRVVQVDLNPTKSGENLIRSDAENLPFISDLFDVVFALDLLEHIPVITRVQIINEISRITKHTAILSFPVSSSISETAENLLNNLEQGIIGRRNQFLNEHEENGLVDPDFIEHELLKHFPYVRSFPNFQISSWFFACVMRAVLSVLPDSGPFTSHLNRLFNSTFFSHNISDPTYRLITVGSHYEVPDEIPSPEFPGFLDYANDMVSELVSISTRSKSLVNYVDTLISELTITKEAYSRLENDYIEKEKNHNQYLASISALSQEITKKDKEFQKLSQYARHTEIQYQNVKNLMHEIEKRLTLIEQSYSELMKQHDSIDSDVSHRDGKSD